MQRETTLQKWVKPVRAIAQVRKAVVSASRLSPLYYWHGMEIFQILKEVKARGLHKIVNEQTGRVKIIKRIEPRIRDNFYDGYFGRHHVHGEVHYFPIQLDKEGLIDHSRCVDCEKQFKETQ